MLSVSSEQVGQIRQHAKTQYPRPCHGVLLGRVIGEDLRWVEEVMPLAVESQDSREKRVIVIPPQIAELEHQAAQRGLQVLGFYVSRPDHPARPGDQDRESALPGYSYVILSVQKGKPAEMHCWRLLEDRSDFEREQTQIRGL